MARIASNIGNMEVGVYHSTDKNIIYDPCQYQTDNGLLCEDFSRF
jgi:hypothetical protein